MFMISTKKFRKPSPPGSLEIGVKPKAKCKFRAAAMLFYTAQKITLTKDAYF
jgi:hypothetical protein